MSSPFASVSLSLGLVLIFGLGACREPGKSGSRAASPEGKSAPSPPSVAPAATDLRDCAAQREGSASWLAELPSALKVEDLDFESEAAGDAQAHLPQLDPLPPRYADKLAALLQKAMLCERTPRGTWAVRFDASLSAQPPGDVLLPWSLLYVAEGGKRVERSADPEDDSSASFVESQHAADAGAPPQRPRFFAAIGAKYYIAERAREDGELSLPESLQLYDYDGDGLEEAILTEHSISLGRQERTVTIWTVKRGRIEPYDLAWHRTAEAARDVDGDGRPDLLFRPLWGREGAHLEMAHSLPDGSFSWRDAAAKAFAVKQPPMPVDLSPTPARDKSAPAPRRLARRAIIPGTGMLCKREYERTRALLATVPHYLGRRHLHPFRAAAAGLQGLLRRSSICEPSHEGAWAVSFAGYQLGSPYKGVTAPHSVVAPWSLVHIGLDGKRTSYALPQQQPDHKAADAMLPFNSQGLMSFEYYVDDPELKDRCRHGYHLPSELRAVDYDGKGEEEVIFAMQSEEELCGSEKFYFDPIAILSFADGQITPYDAKWHLRYDKLEDVDGDGRPDLIYSPYRTSVDLEAACPETHDCGQHDPFAHGPQFAAHALPQGGFSTTDQAAKDYAKRACAQRPRPIGRGDDSVLCARLWGATAKAVLRERFGDSPCTGCEDCESRALTKAWAERNPPLHLP